MTNNKKFGLILLLLLAPMKAEAFLSFCFPISFVILSFILGWPSPLIYEFFPKNISDFLLNESFFGMFVFGFVVDLIIILVIGYILDRKKSREMMPLKKRYIFKFPVYFILAIAALALFMFVDPTCSLN